jgi:hypothetical protein
VPGAVVIGFEEGDQLGASVSGGFDVNADGRVDALVGAPFGDVLATTPSNAGESYVISVVTDCGKDLLQPFFTCGTGACQAEGAYLCVEGALQPVCTPGTPGIEVCDGVDNDCDNTTDEGLGQTTCGTGACLRTVDNCAGGAPQVCAPGSPTPEVCDGIDNDCDGAVDNACFAFSGFFSPVDNPPTVNIMKPGAAVPVKFSLSGFQGYDIFKPGYPISSGATCGSGDADAVEETVSAGSSGLQYDATTDTYTYVWKTSRSMAGTCRVFDLGLKDGTIHTALFRFLRR